jgi:hypothetical protein
MMKTILFSVSLFFISNVQAQEHRWSLEVDSASFFSSPRFTDLNGDGIKDVIYGGGLEAIPSSNGVVAIDGKTGEIIWKLAAETQIYTSALLQDINNDEIEDVFIGGRSGLFYAIDGKTGKIIWEFWPKKKGEARLAGILNFFATQWISDQDNDGYRDLLVANGGDYLAMPNETERKTGQLIVISGKTGKALLKPKVPENREIYYAPHIVFHGKQEDVIFGTGGETIDGALWKISLSDLLANKMDKAVELLRDSTKGFILNSVIADLNLDGIPEIMNARMNATLSAVNGSDNSVLWSHEFPGYECYVTPSLGHFNSDGIPDFFTIISKGTFPVYSEWRLIAIDGQSGEIILDETSGFNQFSPAICVDITNDGIDEIIFVENKLSDPQTFAVTNQLKVINMADGTSQYLGQEQKGMSMASTPSICDTDGNWMYEIYYAVSEMSSDPSIMKSIVHKVELSFRTDFPTWPGYLGPFEDGIIKNY